MNQLTAGEDQLPQESANVTSGSDSSNAKAPRVVISSFLATFPKDWWPIINKGVRPANFQLKLKKKFAN